MFCCIWRRRFLFLGRGEGWAPYLKVSIFLNYPSDTGDMLLRSAFTRMVLANIEQKHSTYSQIDQFERTFVLGLTVNYRVLNCCITSETSLKHIYSIAMTIQPKTSSCLYTVCCFIFNFGSCRICSKMV